MSSLLPFDSLAVIVRPIRPADAPLLVDAFDRLSAMSRYNRFLGGKSRLTAADLHRLTVVDHHDHEALIAISGDQRAVGVARYIRTDAEARAEVAVTVVDAWHRRGLAHVLIDRLTERARAEGIRAFTALIGDDNDAALALLRNFHGHVAVVERSFGVTEYALDLLPGAARLAHQPRTPSCPRSPARSQ